MSVRSRVVTFSLKQNVTELVEKYSKYAWILHDKDIDSETGEMKEPHYHYYLEFGNARYISGIAKEFDIPENMIEVVKNKTGILRYFTHSTESSKEKYAYDMSEVHSSFDIVQATAECDYEGVYDILEDSKSVREALKRLKAVGLSGNALVVVGHVVRTFNEIHKISEMECETITERGQNRYNEIDSTINNHIKEVFAEHQKQLEIDGN